MMQLRSCALTFALACVFTVPLSAQTQARFDKPITFVVAPLPEGSGDMNGPALSPAGKDNAEAIAQALSHSRLSTVYSSEDRRAQETARIVAEQTGAERIPYDYNRQDPEAFVRYLFGSVLPATGGRTVLVVIPRAVVPSFLRHSAGVREDGVAWIRQNDLFIVTIAPDFASVVRASVPPVRRPAVGAADATGAEPNGPAGGAESP